MKRKEKKRKEKKPRHFLFTKPNNVRKLTVITKEEEKRHQETNFRPEKKQNYMNTSRTE